MKPTKREETVKKPNVEFPRRILAPKEVVGLTSLSRTTIWRLERSGEFPTRIQLSRGRTGFFMDEIRE